MNFSSSSAQAFAGWMMMGLLTVAGSAHAHDPGLSSARMRIESGGLEAQLTFAPADIAAALAQSGQPVARLSDVTESQLRWLAGRAVEIKLNDRILAPEVVTVRSDAQNNVEFNLSFVTPAGGIANFRSTLLSQLPRGHRQYVAVMSGSGTASQERLLNAGNDSVTIDLVSAQDKAASAQTSFGGFLALGVHHILTGYDHLCFLFALLVVSRGFLATAKVITCFTLAHSITLAAATLNLVSLPSALVEPLIAASIVYVGVENFLMRGEPKGRGWLTFAFGLVHGLGFASVLREMGVAASGGGVAVPLVSFNLGVELGQIAIAAILLPTLWWLRQRPMLVTRMVPACSALVILAGGFWFVERTFSW